MGLLLCKASEAKVRIRRRRLRDAAPPEKELDASSGRVIKCSPNFNRDYHYRYTSLVSPHHVSGVLALAWLCKMCSSTASRNVGRTKQCSHGVAEIPNTAHMLEI